MKQLSVAAVIIMFVAACGFDDSPEQVSEATQSATANTVISLTFDDTLADQVQVGDMAAARGIRVTFFINSPRLGTTGYMSEAQVIALEQAGHEIGGHTLDHANLPTLTDADARNEVCNDRTALLAKGFRVTSFAYPFGADDTRTQGIVKDCAYNSARDVGGLESDGACPGCPGFANPTPPSNLYEVRTNDSIHSDTTLAALEEYVTDAEQNGGGYVPIVFHHVCDGCDPDSITAPNLATFLDWLAQRAPSTTTATVDQVIGGSVSPHVAYSNLAKNPSLETDANGDQVPDCWQRGGYGTNSATYALGSDAHDGVVAQKITVTSLSSGGRRLVTAQDTGACAPSIIAGHRYTTSAFYKATVQPKFTVYYRNASGAWVYLAESSFLPTSSTYRQGTYTTPAMPSGATAISFGLTIYAVGTLTMDTYQLSDADAQVPADTAPPSFTIACNGTICSPNAYSAGVSVSLAGWDFSGIRSIQYTTNGSDPATSGTTYSSPFTVSATTTVRAVATDNTGNTRPLSKTITFAADTTPPTLTVSCNGVACASTAYSAPVSVSLAASDASGIRAIRYTTDGSDPTSGTVYTGPFTVSATATVRAIATDNAGNTATLSQTITITSADTTPPTLTIACNGAACSSSAYTSAVTVTLTASDASGIRDVRYTTDGSDPTGAGTVYTGPFTVAATATVRAVATDNAGNATALGQTITITGSTDTTPPTLSIACNGAACSPAAYSAAVSVTLSAADASGIHAVQYTTDGSDPATAGIAYTGAFTVSSTATVRAIATDNAGNSTEISQTITISSAPPNLLQNPSLETDANGDQVPDCWQRGGYGTNSATFTLTSDAFDGVRAQNVTITSFTSGGRRLVSAQDTGACAPAVTPGRSYTMTVHYKSNVQPKFSVYYRNTSGAWVWFAESSFLPTSAGYTEGTYTSPPMPSGATAISIGLSIFGTGSLTSDAYTLVQAP